MFKKPVTLNKIGLWILKVLLTGDFSNSFYQNLSEIYRLKPLLTDNGLYPISSMGLENTAMSWNKQLPQRS